MGGFGLPQPGNIPQPGDDPLSQFLQQLMAMGGGQQQQADSQQPWSEQIPGGGSPTQLPPSAQGMPRYGRYPGPASNIPASGQIVPTDTPSDDTPVPQIQGPFGGATAHPQGQTGMAAGLTGMGNNMAFSSLSPELQVRAREGQLEADKANQLAQIKQHEFEQSQQDHNQQMQLEQARLAEEQRRTEMYSTQLQRASGAKTGDPLTDQYRINTEQKGMSPVQAVSDADYQKIYRIQQTMKGKPEKPDSVEQQMVDKYGLEEGERRYSQLHQPPQRDPQQLGISPDGKVFALKPGMTIPEGTKSAAGFEKGEKGPTADETRRADLSRNVNENLDQLEDIIKRRPDLFGPVAGKITRLSMWTGSNDPDVAKLSVLRDQLGIAAVGAHAMRNFQGAEALGKVMTAIDMAPGAATASIATVRRSVGTFQTDAGEKLGSAPKGKQPAASASGGGSSSDVVYARDGNGKLQKAKKGTPIPSGWKVEEAPQ